MIVFIYKSNFQYLINKLEIYYERLKKSLSIFQNKKHIVFFFYIYNLKKKKRKK